MSFPYGKYKNARNAAWQCLLDNQITALPVPVSCIAKRNHVRLGLYTKNKPLVEHLGLGDFMKNDGFSALTSTGFIILYRDMMDSCRIRFTIAHELGHIFLGHLLPSYNGTPCMISPTTDPMEDPVEHEANVFASRILAPACVLWGVGVHSADQIASLCDISIEAAAIRAERMALLYEREKSLLADDRPSCFLMSPLEQRVYQNFQNFIDTYKNNPS